MPIGLTNAPSIFMQTINNLFCNMLDFNMIIFLDDIIVYFHIVKEHFALLYNILAYLCQYMLYCKLKKCSFLSNSTVFLSFNITPVGMHIGDSKVWSLNK